jgi:hypothetical protein
MIWITWENQRRNRTLSKRFDADLYEVVFDEERSRRYFLSCIETIKILKKHKPKFLFVQNPSLFLSLLALSLRKIFGYRLIIDEHNSGLYPLEGTNKLLNKIARFVAAKADFAIVTNKNLSDAVEAWGGRPLVLPDPLPDFAGNNTHLKDDKIFNVLFVCTWASDEPYLEVIEAARVLGGRFKFRITGNPKNKVKNIDIPENVELTGYIEESLYLKYMENSDVVIVLTNRENCLNCGAYEAIAMEKPLVLSETMAIMEYFSGGAVFAKNNCKSIVERLIFVRENEWRLRLDVLNKKKDILKEWEILFQRVQDTIGLTGC